MIGRAGKMVFRRHGDKAAGPKAKEGFQGKTGLQKKGWLRAFGRGMVGVGTLGKTEFASSPLLRVKNTAKAARAGHRSLFGRTTGEVVEKKHLDAFGAIKNMGAAEDLIAKHGDDGVLRMWLDGKLSTDIMAPANEWASEVLRQEIPRMRQGQMRNVQNFTNSWGVEAIYELLTGAKFEQTLAPRTPGSKGKGVRFTEPLSLAFDKKGRAILTYRKNRFDVTNRLKEIVGQ